MKTPTWRFRLASSLLLAAGALSSAWGASTHEGPWRGLVEKIQSAGSPDSTAVLVLFDRPILDSLRSRLSTRYTVVLFVHPDVPNHDAYARIQLGQMFREASVATETFPDLWVVGNRTGAGRTRAARFADQAASSSRWLVLRDSVAASSGMVQIRRWVNQPGGSARRAEIRQSLAYAESVMAAGPPKRTRITRPFTASELYVDPDTLSFYIAKLADTSFYTIGGCSEVEIVNWTACGHLGRLGPGVIPSLVGRINDPDPFVRERVQEALMSATQDEQVLARSDGEYVKFYDQPTIAPQTIVAAWWKKYGHFWTTDSPRR